MACWTANRRPRAYFTAGLQSRSMQAHDRRARPRARPWPYIRPVQHRWGRQSVRGQAARPSTPTTNAPSTLAARAGRSGQRSPSRPSGPGAPLGAPWNLPTAAITMPRAASSPRRRPVQQRRRPSTTGGDLDPTTDNLVTFNARTIRCCRLQQLLMAESYLVVPDQRASGGQGQGVGGRSSASSSAPPGARHQDFGRAPATQE